jgi:hypothetical protein
MNTIFKILVILVVAALIGGLFYGAVTASSSGFGQSRSTNERFGQFDRGGEARGLQFPAEAISNLVIISVVAVIYLNATKWLNRKRATVKVAS